MYKYDNIIKIWVLSCMFWLPHNVIAAKQELNDVKQLSFAQQSSLSGQNAATLNGEQLSLNGWSASSNITLNVNMDDVKFGGASISGVTSLGGQFDRIEYRFPTKPATSYTISLWAKRELGQTQALTQWEGVEDFEVQYIDTPFWRRYEQTVIATGDEIIIRAYASIEGNIGDDIYIDGLVITSPDVIFADRFEEVITEPVSISDRAVDTGLTNLITQNPNFDGTKGWSVESRGHLFSTDSHTQDGSGSVELVAHLNQLAGPSFACENGQRYVLSAYMKVTNFPKGQSVSIQVHGGSSSWNASMDGVWEEVLVPFIPSTENGMCRIFIGTDRRSHSTTFEANPNGPEYEPQPEQVRADGSNLDSSSRVFIDDVKVVRSDEIQPREIIITKNHYEGPYVRIDDLGNFTIKRNGEWIPVFPKMMYYSRHGDEGISPAERLFQRSLRYVEYGFNGLMGVFLLERDVIRPLEAGIEFVAPSGSQPFRVDGNDFIKTLIPALKTHLESVGKPEAFLWYYYDNENNWRQFREHKEKLIQIIDELDTDEVTQKRMHPIFMLNGTYGLARSYLNDMSKLMDFSGSYSALGSAGRLQLEPKETLGVIDKSHNQKAPAPMIQLQCYHHEQFVPALFFGIIQGGKALGMWRDGTEFQPSGGEPCQLNFEDNVWAPAVKGEDGIFARLDTMLPLIREPHWTRWSASSNESKVRIGTRNYAGDHYIILSNHADEPKTVNVFIDGIEFTGAEDYFTGEFINSSLDGEVDIPIGHHNDGYRVVRLL